VGSAAAAAAASVGAAAAAGGAGAGMVGRAAPSAAALAAPARVAPPAALLVDANEHWHAAEHSAHQDPASHNVQPNPNCNPNNAQQHAVGYSAQWTVVLKRRPGEKLGLKIRSYPELRGVRVDEVIRGAVLFLLEQPGPPSNCSTGDPRCGALGV
jgi:hypothetical protein